MLEFLRRHRLAVQASVGPDGAPQAAVVGFAVSDHLELIFDTVVTSRKYKNLYADPRVALVVGWDGEQTAQIEGIADFPVGEDLQRLQRCYIAVYPDGQERLSWPGITHVRVRPFWVRYSDFSQDPPCVEELSGEQLWMPPRSVPRAAIPLDLSQA